MKQYDVVVSTTKADKVIRKTYDLDKAFKMAHYIEMYGYLHPIFQNIKEQNPHVYLKDQEQKITNPKKLYFPKRIPKKFLDPEIVKTLFK